jgi:hypothetical protein
MAAAPAINYIALLKGLPAGAWVAISGDASRVIAYGAELQAVIDRARAEGEQDPVILRVPEQAVTLFL